MSTDHASRQAPSTPVTVTTRLADGTTYVVGTRADGTRVGHDPHTGLLPQHVAADAAQQELLNAQAVLAYAEAMYQLSIAHNEEGKASAAIEARILTLLNETVNSS